MNERTWSRERVRTRLILLIAAVTVVLAYIATRPRSPSPPPSAPLVRPAVALAVVFPGQEIWLGNMEHEPDHHVQYKGALKALRAAFASHPPARVLPPGSVATVIGYAAGVDVRLPLGPLEALDEEVFGAEREYRSRIGSELAMGLDRAIAELARENGPGRRVMLIIGDGNDTSDEAAALRMPRIARDLKRYSIEVHAIVLPSELSPDGHHLGALTTDIQLLRHPDELSAALARVWRDLRVISI